MSSYQSIIQINYFLPRVKGPGFNSTPDIIKSFWVTFDKTKRYDNIIKDSITPFDFNALPKGDLILLEVDLLQEKVPILDLY